MSDAHEGRAMIALKTVRTLDYCVIAVSGKRTELSESPVESAQPEDLPLPILSPQRKQLLRREQSI